MTTAVAGDSLKTKFRQVLIGFEKYSFSEEQLAEVERDLELCAEDLATCEACDGKLCRTIQNKSCADPLSHSAQNRSCTDECYQREGVQSLESYYALHHFTCRMYERPGFAVFKCPGAAERREQLREQIISRWYDDR